MAGKKCILQVKQTTLSSNMCMYTLSI